MDLTTTLQELKRDAEIAAWRAVANAATAKFIGNARNVFNGKVKAERELVISEAMARHKAVYATAQKHIAELEGDSKWDYPMSMADMLDFMAKGGSTGPQDSFVKQALAAGIPQSKIDEIIARNTGNDTNDVAEHREQIQQRWDDTEVDDGLVLSMPLRLLHELLLKAYGGVLKARDRSLAISLRNPKAAKFAMARIPAYDDALAVLQQAAETLEQGDYADEIIDQAERGYPVSLWADQFDA